MKSRSPKALLICIAGATLTAAMAGCEAETRSAVPVSKNTGEAAEPVDVGPSTHPDQNARDGSRPGRPRDISFDDLEFEIEKDADFARDMLTPEIEAMDGTRVKIYGFILPASVFRQTGIDRFVLIRDNQECCFGPGAYIYHNIQVEMSEGNTADFSVRPVAVEGELHIRPWYAPDGKCYSVFHMTGDRVTK